MTTPDIPEKLYYSISEVKKITGIEPYVLRFWEAEFPTLRPRKNKKGHRTYRKKDIKLIFKIKELLYEHKYTIPGAKEVLAGRKPAPAAAAPETPQGGGTGHTELLERIHGELSDLVTLLEKEKADNIFGG